MIIDLDICSVRKNLKGQWKSTGDPTEVALQVFAMKLGLPRSSLTREMLEAADEGSFFFSFSSLSLLWPSVLETLPGSPRLKDKIVSYRLVLPSPMFLTIVWRLSARR